MPISIEKINVGWNISNREPQLTEIHIDNKNKKVQLHYHLGEEDNAVELYDIQDTDPYSVDNLAPKLIQTTSLICKRSEDQPATAGVGAKAIELSVYFYENGAYLYEDDSYDFPRPCNTMYSITQLELGEASSGLNIPHGAWVSRGGDHNK